MGFSLADHEEEVSTRKEGQVPDPPKLDVICLAVQIMDSARSFFEEQRHRLIPGKRRGTD